MCFSIVFSLLSALVAHAQPGHLMDCGGGPAARGFVFFAPPTSFVGPVPGPRVGGEVPARAMPEAGLPPMAQALLGGVELSKAEVLAWRRSVGGKPGIVKTKPGEPGPPVPAKLGDLLLVGDKGEARLGLTMSHHAEVVAAREGGESRRLRAEQTLTAMASWTWYAGPWDAAPAPLKAGERVEVPAGMHRSSWWWLDEATQRDRGFLGTRFAVGPATRTLGDAPMFVRLPKGYTPRTPAGLLVWIDPSPVGHHPGIFEAVADELNLAVVGVGKSGNTVLMGDRTQKVLDAVATALTLVHVDRARVYATGISGGGRMSGIVLFAFPDLFTGGVAMAGVPHYEDKPTPEGRVWPRYVNRPSGSRLEMVRGHRFAAISGAKDYNHAQTAATIGWQQADGMDVRLWSIPDLGHELPDAGTYAEALRWVDERARAGWEASVKLGDSLWKAVPPESTSRHEGLRRVMREAAWTPGAWKAAVALGIAGESESAGAR